MISNIDQKFIKKNIYLLIHNPYGLQWQAKCV